MSLRSTGYIKVGVKIEQTVHTNLRIKVNAGILMSLSVFVSCRASLRAGSCPMLQSKEGSTENNLHLNYLHTKDICVPTISHTLYLHTINIMSTDSVQRIDNTLHDSKLGS